MVKNPPANAGDARSIPRSGRRPGEGSGNALVFLPGESHGQRSLVGYSLEGRKRVGRDFETKQHCAYQNFTSSSMRTFRMNL